MNWRRLAPQHRDGLTDEPRWQWTYDRSDGAYVVVTHVLNPEAWEIELTTFVGTRDHDGYTTLHYVSSRRKALRLARRERYQHH